MNTYLNVRENSLQKIRNCYVNISGTVFFLDDLELYPGMAGKKTASLHGRVSAFLSTTNINEARGLS